MELFSKLFRGDAKLRAALNVPGAHIMLKKPREHGTHVHKIQQALFRLGFSIDRAETNVNEFGKSTEDAVAAFKNKEHIVNPAYQASPDKIVGQLTMEALDTAMRILDRENGFSPEINVLRPPAYEAQIRANSCWAACLVMWRRSQGSGSFTQQAYINSAPDFMVGPAGINISGLQTVINDENQLALVKMEMLQVENKDGIPNLRKLISQGSGNGHIYLAFQRSGGGGGHCHVVFGYTLDDFGNGLVFDALDPDPNVGRTRTTMGSYFSKFPALVGFRQA